MLADPTAAEREVLGAIPYQPNEAVLHTDASPDAAPARGPGRAGTSTSSAEPRRPRTTVTYWMNRLQRLAAPTATTASR